MVNVKLLQDRIDASGLKISFIADKCGLTYQGLKYKLENKRAFKIAECGALKELLNLSDQDFSKIFFASDVDGESTER